MATVERTQHLDFDDDCGTVLRMLTDADFYRAKYEALGFEGLQLTIETPEDADFGVLARYRTESELPLPSWARKALPDTIRVEQRDCWDSARSHGSIEIGIHGAPVRISARMTLTPHEGGARNRVDWAFGCRVPVIGKRVAELVAEDVCAKAERDHAFVRAQIAHYR